MSSQLGVQLAVVMQRLYVSYSTSRAQSGPRDKLLSLDFLNMNLRRRVSSPGGLLSI